MTRMPLTLPVRSRQKDQVVGASGIRSDHALTSPVGGVLLVYMTGLRSADRKCVRTRIASVMPATTMFTGSPWAAVTSDPRQVKRKSWCDGRPKTSTTLPRYSTVCKRDVTSDALARTYGRAECRSVIRRWRNFEDVQHATCLSHRTYTIYAAHGLPSLSVVCNGVKTTHDVFIML